MIELFIAFRKNILSAKGTWSSDPSVMSSKFQVKSENCFNFFRPVICGQIVMFLLYRNCSKISNTFLFLFSNTMWVIKACIHKMLVRIANREDSDQTASSEAV